MVLLQQCNKYSAAKPGSPAKGRGRQGSFTRKCSALVRQQRARIYILRRCATMLLCWYIHGDD